MNNETTVGIAQPKSGLVNLVSIILVGVAVLLGIAVPVQFGNATFAVFESLSTYCGWWYMLATNIFVIFPIFLAFSRFGKLTLGKADEKPEFSTISWFAMLFGAGHGVGLVFYGVAEPLTHYLAVPFGADPGSTQAAVDAMRASLIHWGLHPWACYAVIALCMAYFQFRKGAPGLMSGIGAYLANFIHDSLDCAPYGGPYKSWLKDWTLYYWAWWIAWSPFVGSFVARISRGRTVRQFVAGILLVPTLDSFIWFGIFGGSGLALQMSGLADLAAVVKENISMGIFALYASLPLGYLMSILVIVLMAIFFATSASSSTFVLGMYTSEGALNPSKPGIILWGGLLAALALVLLVTGGIRALQTASLAAAFPFSIIMVLACYCLWHALNKDFAEGQEVH